MTASVCLDKLAAVTALSLILGNASAETVYFGDAAIQAASVTDAGGPRADTVGVLTYILHTGEPTIYTAPSDQELTLTEVNFFADASGTLTPFVARYLGGSTQSASSYEVLSVGDALTVTSSDNTLGPSAGDHLENRAFTVESVNPTISVNAGDMIVAGWMQVGNIVYIGGGGPQSAADYIANGDSLTGAVIGGSPTLESNWAFDRPMQFNIGFEIASPSTPFQITNIDYDPIDDTFRFTWNSQPDKVYSLFWSPDLANWDREIDDSIDSQGETTTYPAPGQPAEPNPGTTLDGRPALIFFRVEK